MSILEFGDGLADNPSYYRSNVGVFFDNDHNLLEEPSLWMMDVVKRKSRSVETSRQYAHILQRYLNWLDDEGYGSESWQSIDEDIFDSYLAHVCSTKKDSATISHESASYYAYRIYDFYNWARNKGYDHYLDIDKSDIEFRVDQHQSLLQFQQIKNVTVLDFNLPTGRPALYQKEISKFVVQSDFELALTLFKDPTYALIATIIRITGMRPKDLLQIPYRGKHKLSGFIPYDIDEIPPDLISKSIYYEFASKGKRRSIEFPGSLWRYICLYYVPLRRERAKIYFAEHGISPPNSVLFLNQSGLPINYQMLYREFAQIPRLAAEQGYSAYRGTRFTARMLRHSFATYFVYEALKAKGRLGQHFVYDAALDEELRKIMGHSDIKITLKYYVHLVNRFVHDDLLADMKRSQIDTCLTSLLDAHGYVA